VIVGVVPAAGRSRRMGREKPLLRLRGRSFLEHVVEALRSGGCDPVLVVVGDPEGETALLAGRLGARVLRNPDPSEGPVSSLRTALRALPAQAQGVAFLPVDHPLVCPDTVARLVEAFREGSAPVVVPTCRGRRGHPVLFRAGLFPELLEPDLPLGARTVVRRHAREVLEVPVDDPGVLTDVDTPGDLQRVRSES